MVAKDGKLFLLLCIIAGIFFILYNQFLKQKLGIKHVPLKHGRKSRIQLRVNPWNATPQFALYLRFTSSKRWKNEYKNVLLRTMKIFFPQEKVKLLVVLDGEKKKDHKLGKRIAKKWPYPEICYRDPGNPAVYHKKGKSRMFWDMMYPDHCTNLPYVGYIDTDTFFSTLVTPNLLFENGKPVIVAKIGMAPYKCWEDTTEAFLHRKEVMQCMSTFPVMIKTEHMKEMRQVLAKEQGKDFDTIFMEAPTEGAHCLCQFSIMCNYIWYYHRDDYAWHLQMVPNGKWKGKNWFPSQVPLEYYYNDIKPEEKIPIPRTSIHLRYTITNGIRYLGKEPPPNFIEDFIQEGLCYSAGFKYCPLECKKWNVKKVHYNLFAFEFYKWFWDKRCKKVQKKHYRIVEKLVDFYLENRIPIFGVNSTDELCKLISG